MNERTNHTHFRVISELLAHRRSFDKDRRPEQWLKQRHSRQPALWVDPVVSPKTVASVLPLHSAKFEGFPQLKETPYNLNGPPVEELLKSKEGFAYPSFKMPVEWIYFLQHCTVFLYTAWELLIYNFFHFCSSVCAPSISISVDNCDLHQFTQ